MFQGEITVTSGSISSHPHPGPAMPTAWQSAAEALALALALELTQVCVNAIIPGLIDTPRLHTAHGDKRDTIDNNRAANLPGRRLGTTDEVAQVILMLMTNCYMTEKVVHVNGGGGAV